MGLQLKDGLDHLHLCGCGFKPAERCPIVDDQPCAYHVRASVDGPCAQWHLQQVRQLFQLLHCGLGVDQSPLVAEHAVSADQHVICNCVSENLDTQSIRYDLLSLFIQVRVNQGHIVVACHTVSERGQFFLDSDNFHSFWKTVPDVP